MSAFSQAVEVMDRLRWRVLRAICYGLSQALPLIIKGLPSAHVYQTPEANLLRIGVRSDGRAGDYRMFFWVKRHIGAGIDLTLFVESVYSPDLRQALAIAHMSKVRFAVLVGKR